MTNKVNNIVDLTLISVGSWWSIENIKSILGIIILVIQIMWILYKFVIALLKANKERDAHAVKDAFNEAIDSLEELNYNMDKEDNNNENVQR